MVKSKKTLSGVITRQGRCAVRVNGSTGLLVRYKFEGLCCTKIFYFITG